MRLAVVCIVMGLALMNVLGSGTLAAEPNVSSELDEEPMSEEEKCDAKGGRWVQEIRKCVDVFCILDGTCKYIDPKQE